ncbi:hypothetical protein H2248_002055 [Termitomyces sp. 'cryptogamus']|nr:hypothetical protein H2248_002055 [Termitomyces sp. 'cryptogamus']
MPPRLRVLAGTGTKLAPITHLVNTTNAFSLVSDQFEGEIAVCIKDLTRQAKEDAHNYFERPERQGITWSIQVRGRFLEPISADDVLFGNTFDRPLILPWGSGAALKFMRYIDPTLEHDLTSQTHPWALSPLISMMPHFVHTRIAPDRHCNNHLASPSGPSVYKQTLAAFPPKIPLSDDTSQLHLACADATASSSSRRSTYSSLSSSYPAVPKRSPKEYRNVISTIKEKVKGKGKGEKEEIPGLGLVNASQRRAYFASAAHRQDIMFGPEDILTTDICYGFLDFSPSMTLRLPGGLSFDLVRYWDGQPARFVCCKRKHGLGDGKLPWGQVFWNVIIEMSENEEGFAFS